MQTAPFTLQRHASIITLGLSLLLHATVNAEELSDLSAEARQRIQQALPAKATAQPLKPRHLLIFTRNQEYQGHAPAIASSCEAFTLMGKNTGAFETTVTDDPAVFERESLSRFDAVFLNNTLGATFTDTTYRKNLIEFVTRGGGLMGVHSTVIAFTKSLWPAQEDWPEFGYLLGARGYAHHHGYVNEPITIAVYEPAHPLARAFGGKGFPLTSEFFRHHEPYSRHRVRVILSMDTDNTDLSRYKPGDPCLRADNDYALAWVKNYGRGRVFYTGIGHNPEIYEDSKMLKFHLDATQFVLGDLSVPTTPSAKLSPAVFAQEKLGWRIGLEAYTFHKFTFFETIDKTAELGLSYIGGLCSEQPVSKDIPKNFDQDLSDDELSQIRMKMESAGVRMPTYYVRDFPKDETGCRKLFEFGNKMGVETFIGEPTPDQLDLLDGLANEFAINIAIHNHDPSISPTYWRPENVLEACEGRSKRIGACPDNGYWLRSGIDPIEALRILKDRIITVHLHDLHATGSDGHDVPWGSGTARTGEFIQELHRLGIQPTMIGIEHANDWFESMPKIARSIEFYHKTTLELGEEPLKDADGNTYQTVRIGNQLWTAENLRTTKFNDGTPIPQVTDPKEWKELDTAAFCYYENNPEQGNTRGILYNWHAASAGKIAPKGWRVPTIEEQFALRDYLITHGYNHDGTTDGNRIAKAMATQTEWPYLEKDAYGNPVPDIPGMIGNRPETNNKSRFSARPAGCRWSDGSFHAGGTSVYWWSVTPHEDSHARHTSLHTWFSKFGDNHHHQRTGFSIRLIRDDHAK